MSRIVSIVKTADGRFTSSEERDLTDLTEGQLVEIRSAFLTWVYVTATRRGWEK